MHRYITSGNLLVIESKEVFFMNILKKLLVLSTLSFTLVGFETTSSAAEQTLSVKSGETSWKVVSKTDNSTLELMKENHDKFPTLYEKEIDVTDQEKELMARLVTAEAKGEPYEGKVAVAEVIINRVEHEEFPDTVKEVVYEQVSGTYAFSPVQNGEINKPADEESMEAVEEALVDKENDSEAIYFYNPEIATDTWILTRQVTETIGNHRFAI
jgi:N-acetylmuramoyl-L-alanine amidase